MIPKVNHLWLVLINVLVLQSFLAVSPVSKVSTVSSLFQLYLIQLHL